MKASTTFVPLCFDSVLSILLKIEMRSSFPNVPLVISVKPHAHTHAYTHNMRVHYYILCECVRIISYSIYVAILVQLSYPPYFLPVLLCGGALVVGLKAFSA